MSKKVQDKLSKAAPALSAGARNRGRGKRGTFILNKDITKSSFTKNPLDSAKKEKTIEFDSFSAFYHQQKSKK